MCRLNLEMKLEVWDSPNSAGIVIDAVRCAKIGLDHGLKGALIAPSSYFKKSPPVQIPDDDARELVERYIKDPKGIEKLMRTNPPILKRELPPAGKLARSAGAAKLQKAIKPAARKARGDRPRTATRTATAMRAAVAARPSRPAARSLRASRGALRRARAEHTHARALRHLRRRRGLGQEHAGHAARRTAASAGPRPAGDARAGRNAARRENPRAAARLRTPPRARSRKRCSWSRPAPIS